VLQQQSSVCIQLLKSSKMGLEAPSRQIVSQPFKLYDWLLEGVLSTTSHFTFDVKLCHVPVVLVPMVTHTKVTSAFGC